MCWTICGMRDVKESYVTMHEAVECSDSAGVFGKRLPLQFTVLLENQNKEQFVNTLNPSVLCSDTGEI